MDNENQFLIYQTDSGSIEVEVAQESVWLTQAQMVDLFGKTKQNISLHVRNIFKEGELEEGLVVKESLTAAADGKRYKTKYYNLDVVISVGYRVKSQQGTRFRIWANQILKEYLMQGYALDQKRLQQHRDQLDKLEKALTLFQQNIIDQANLPEAKGLVSVITDYARTFILLNQFDSERLPTTDFDEDIRYEIRYEEARLAIDALKQDLMGRGEATELVGNEKDDSFAGILGSVVQSFGGQYLYASIEEQAAHLLYFVILYRMYTMQWAQGCAGTAKNHPFMYKDVRYAAGAWKRMSCLRWQ